MMKKIMALVLLLLPLIAAAGPVDEAEAMQRAQAFLVKRGVSQKAAPLQMAARSRGESKGIKHPYYVFNIGEKDGFVIISGDDRTVPVLGYADCGNLDEYQIPDGLRYMLDGYTEQIEWMEKHPDAEVNHASEARYKSATAARLAIAPIIQTRWNQGTPYNNLCPLIDDTKTVTGCVATSMAQLMYYYTLPTASTTPIPGYTTTTKDKNKESISLTVDGLPTTTFNWNAMTTTYTSSSTGAAADEVAKLMQYCGVSLQMKYGLNDNGGSSAFNEVIPFALKTYFGYDGGVRNVYRKTRTYADWVSLIYSELVEGRPLILGGQSTGGGHSFVCDGYDTDDYFHINWGWGGGSDGYFRLSLLNPDEQGIGGSSTLDGFSYGQNAIIGIQPPTVGTKDYCLSLEGLNLGAPNDQLVSKTYSRASNEDPFTDISLMFVVFSYYVGTNKFDVAIQLVDGNGDVKHTLYSDSPEINLNNGWGGTLSGCTIPPSVTDGTYYIKIMSRLNGSSKWQECYDGDCYQLTAVVSGNKLTINVPITASVLPPVATIAVKGNLTQGYEQEVTATITGGSVDYQGDIILLVNESPVMGKSIEVPAGETVAAHFAYTPSETGTNTLKLVDHNGSQIGSTTSVTIHSSDASDLQTLTIVPTITNLNGGKLYGNAVRVTATVTNPDDTYKYVGKVNCSLRTYNSIGDDVGNYVDAIVQRKSIEIAKSGSSDITFAFDGLDPGKCYRLRFTYLQDGKTTSGPITDCYAMDEGYVLYAADGTTSIFMPSASIDAASATCVDLTAIVDPSTLTVTPSTNPNCIYLLAESATAPSMLESSNVVRGGVIDNLTLTDGHDFFTPVAIAATNASYTRTFTVPAAGTSGWNTLFLPFTASTVTCTGLGTVDWFHTSGDEDKNFWLRDFTADALGTVTFDYAYNTTIAANTPYIIAVPGDTWGDEWQMTGKTVTFSGTSVVIAPSINAEDAPTTPGISGNHYKFCGSTVGSSVSDVYLLNNKGSKFVKATSATAVEPFRAWFTPVNISALTHPSLSIVNPDITGIKVVECDVEEGRGEIWYSLDGRRLPVKPTAKGVYLFKGHKIVIK